MMKNNLDDSNEMMSVSQVPSVMQTLDRKNQIIELINGNATPSSHNHNNLNHNPSTASNTNNNNNPNEKSNNQTIDYKRMASIRSDFSTLSSNSTRSMLSEAKAKLEAFSGKTTRLVNLMNNGGTLPNTGTANSNNGTSYLNINKNFENHNKSSSNNNVNSNGDTDYSINGQHEKEETNYYETCDYIQTKF